jgi:hypothetical protein
MTRILSVAVVLFLAASAAAADRYARDPQHVAIATTGRIVKIDYKNRTLKLRGSDGSALSIRSVSQNFAQMLEGLKQRIGVTLPGGITIALPGRGKNTSKAAAQVSTNAGEYIVTLTEDTVFHDGGETIRFEDFRSGDVISVHGALAGSTLTASRIAKWME